MAVSEDMVPKLSNHAEKLRRQGIMMKGYCDVSALPRRDPTKKKQSGFEIIITKTRVACVITGFWPNQEMGRK